MHRLKTLLLFGLTGLVVLGALDLYLQLAGIQTPMETRIDPELGPTYIPGKAITRFNEGFFVGSANEYGFMGPAVPPERRPGERRILLLGDSFILGHTVLPRHHFARMLEAELDSATGEDVHALNFGKADFNFWNMYQYYRDFAARWDHDLALFFVGSGDLIPARQVATDLYPFVELEGDSLVVDTSFRESDLYRFYTAIEPVFTRSAVLRLLFNAQKMVQRGELAHVLLDKFAPGDAHAEPAPDRPRPEREMPELSRAILHALARDPRNVLVIQTDLAANLRAEVAAAGMPVIDLGARIDQLEAAGQDPYYWPVTGMRGHWNHATHPVVGRFLARQLLEKGLVWPDTTAARR